MENNISKCVAKGAFYLFVATFYCKAIAQKPCVDMGIEKKWPRLDNFEVSNNGAYFCYNTADQSGTTLVLESANFKWKMTIPGAVIGPITQNNEKALFRQNDSLGIVSLSDEHEVQYIYNINAYTTIKRGDNNDWLLYSLKNLPNETIIKDMQSGKERKFTGVDQYWSNSEGNIFLLERKRAEGASTIYQLSIPDITDNTEQNIWEGRKITSLIIDHNGGELAFSAAGILDSINLSIWVYKRGDQRAKKLLSANSNQIERGFRIKDIVEMNGTDNRVFFNLESDKIEAKVDVKTLPVDIWNYKDSRLQSAQLQKMGSKVNVYKAFVNILDGKVIRLEYDHENIISRIYSDKTMNFMLGIRVGDGDAYNEWNWNKNGLVSVYLVSLRSGQKKWVQRDLPLTSANNYVLSYNENYIFYFDVGSRNYYSYDIRDSSRRNLTSMVKADWINYDLIDWPDKSRLPYSIVGSIENEDAVLVYDQRDIFELNPRRANSAVNLTKTTNRRKNLEIRLAPESGREFISRDKRAIYYAFDRTNKEEGFFRAALDSLRHVTTFNLQRHQFDELEPVKARDSDIYFVSKMTAEDFPNTYLTTDFKTYKPATKLCPEKDYNWMTTELITWKNFGGGICQGILYKPENFDAHKKYSLLVYYYERQSDNLYKFLMPGASSGQLNIPLYVSNGYLVFTPDIHYKIGWPGRSALNAVISGVTYLGARKYINMKRIGLQGHSFGGFETNYIVTHSHLFAAAMSASGMTDFVSAYGSIIGDGTSRQRQYELYRDRIGANLWDKPNLYFENSPVLKANQVTTPLLMMTNKADEDVPYQQGVEFFTALRRLGKKAWMLQYDGQGHNVDGVAAEDLTVRMFQFFNYYLKGLPPSKWMTKGVPAELKGIDSGLELDKSGEIP